MEWTADIRDRVADGTITVSYRLWSRPKVKVGGIYRSGSVMIEIDEIELLPFSFHGRRAGSDGRARS